MAVVREVFVDSVAVTAVAAEEVVVVVVAEAKAVATIVTKKYPKVEQSLQTGQLRLLPVQLWRVEVGEVGEGQLVL